MSNRHPADELAETRNKIRHLKEYEDDLRNELLGLPRAERIGSQYVAIAVQKVRKVLDIDKLENEIGDISKFYKEVPFTMVRSEKLK